MNLSVHIPQFEGPLALLLHLIRREEMNILDINVQLITSQYLEYIKKMKGFDLEVAGDFIAMAATLLQIKSKMLLPDDPDESGGGEDEEPDPREDLIQRLLEYQCFQEASKTLYSRSLLDRDVFKRFRKELILPAHKEAEIILDENALFSLMACYVNSVRRMKRAIHRVAKKTRSITNRILEIRDRFIVNQRITFRELVGQGKDFKEELLITFLSCLELSKMGFISMYQSKIYGDIHLTGKRRIRDDDVVVARVGDYNGSDGQSKK